MRFFNENLTMPGDWVAIAQRILRQNETVMVLGKTDSGKTSTVILFVQYLIRRNRRVAIIDGDIGQSTLGPPGTINMVILNHQNLKSGIIPVDNTVFIGAISPERCFQKLIDGFCILNKICQKSRVDAVFIDTTGFISGNLGMYLKSRIIKKIKPTILIALQFTDELEPILKLVENRSSINVFRLRPCQNINQKNWLERKTRRKRQFEIYFKEAELKQFDFSETVLKGPYFGQGHFLGKKEIETVNTRYQTNLVTAERKKSRMIFITKDHQNGVSQDSVRGIKNDFSVPEVTLISENWFHFLLVSFTNQEGLSMGLGIIQGIDFQQKKLMAYVAHHVSRNDFTKIEMGQLKISPDGKELPYRQPDNI